MDVSNLTKGQIIIGADYEPWIKTYRLKTQIPVNVPLLLNAQRLIRRYRDNPRATAKDTYPILSNQKINSYLEEVDLP